MCQIKLFASLLAASLWVSLSWAEPQCERINKTISNLHIHCGYNLTARFNFDKHFDSASRAIVSLRSLLKNCSAFVDLMMCSLFLPRCTEEIKGPYLPCRGVCYDFANNCKDIIMEKGLEWTVAMCDILPEKDNPQTTKGYRERCFTPSNYKDSGKKYKHNCSDIVIPACQGITGYKKTVVSEKIQRRFSNYITSKINYNDSEPCSPLRKEIVCAENLPACVDGLSGFLCKDNCLNFFNKCRSPFFYKEDMCMEFPKREGTPKENVICKQTHWPRSENWQLPENPGTSAPPTTQEPGIKTGSQGTQKPKTDVTEYTTEKPNTKKPHTDGDVPPPGIRGQRKPEDKKSGSSELLIGLVVTFGFLVFIALAVLGYVWYRRKRSRQFDYQKQVLYSEDKAEEFEIFT